MQTMRTRPGVRRGNVVWLPAEDIAPNPVQPRKLFDESALEELSQSIRSYGILNPLTVRCRGGRYELVAGERRLRAAKLAGLEEVPCIVLDVNMQDASLIALIENLQRRDLDFVEEAVGLSRLIRMFGMSQEEAAKRIGKSQSAVANKLRLLKLPPDVLENLRSYGLSERHGRALLRLPEPGSQRMALEYIAANDLTVAATEEYIEADCAGGGAGEAGAAPHPDPQGCTRLSQQPQPFAGSHEAGRHRRGRQARGNRRFPYPHNLYPKGTNAGKLSMETPRTVQIIRKQM